MVKCTDFAEYISEWSSPLTSTGKNVHVNFCNSVDALRQTGAPTSSHLWTNVVCTSEFTGPFPPPPGKCTSYPSSVLQVQTFRLSYVVLLLVGFGSLPQFCLSPPCDLHHGSAGRLHHDIGSCDVYRPTQGRSIWCEPWIKRLLFPFHLLISLALS